jgi:hypothetical protein
MVLLPFEREMFAVSYSDQDVQISFGMRVEQPQNFCIAQIPEYTNYARSARQPFPSNTGLSFSREMAVATIKLFQNLTFIVCNRHVFQDLVTLPTQVVA